MKTTTSKYKELIASNSTRDYLVKINMTLADETALELTNEDLWSGTFSLETASSGTSSFDLGCAVIGKCKFTLRNFDERFNQYDFFNATAVVWVGLDGDLDENDTQVYYRMGFFTVDEPTYNGSLIALELLDNMWKFDKPLPIITYNSSTTLYSIVSAICTHCGVSLATQNFHGKDFVISKAPEQEMNCRELLQYVAMIGCNFCVIDSQGYLNIKWYNSSATPTDDSLDGGTFSTNTTPYSDGDTADGGNFTNYNSGASYDGGTFTDNSDVVYFTRNFDATLGTDEITITGLQTIIGDEGFAVGTNEYMLEIENPLITADNAFFVLNLIWEVLENFKIRQFTVRGLSDLSVEVGDCCAIMDVKGNINYSYVTNNTFTLTSQSAGLYAVSPSRTLTKRYSKTVTTAVEQARKQTDEIISDYDLSVQMMNNLAVNAMGGYQDYEDLSTGGRVWYLSNMPITKTDNVCTFTAGSTVFKVTGDGFFVSTDAGSTWVNGYNAQTGQLVVNVLNAIGISAEWVKTGTLTVGGNGANAVIEVKDSSNNPICYINSNGLTMYAGRIQSNAGNWYLDTSTGDVKLSATTKVGNGSTTLNDFATKASTIVDVDVEYAKNQSSTTAPTTGWSTSSPQWQEGYYIWQRTKTTDGNGTASYSTAVCIQGADGQQGATGVGVSAIVEQYYLSTSNSTPTGGTWQNTQPTWVHGKYIWTRSQITWTDSNVTTTTPILAETANQANEAVYQLDNGLDQEGVYNRLTNNSQNEGIYLYNSHLYVNASMINTGKLSADRIEGGSMSADYIDGGSLFFGTASKGFLAGCYTWSLSNSFPTLSQSNYYNYDVNWVMTGGRFGTFVIVVETTSFSESINATYEVLHTTNGGSSWTSVKQDSLIKGWNRIDSKFIISRFDINNDDYYRLKITNNGSDSFSGDITLYQAHTIIDEEGVLSRSFKSECADIVISRIQAYSSDYTPSASNMHVVENILFTPNNIGQNTDFEILVQLDTDDTTTGTIGIWVSYWDDYSNGWRLDTNIPYLYPRNVSSFVTDYPNGYSFNGYLFDKDDSTLYQVQIERLRPSISSDVSDIFTVSVKNGRLMELSDTQLCGSFKGSLKGSFNGDINGWVYDDYEDTLKSWGSLVDSDGDKSLAFINYLSKKGFSIGSGEKTANKYGMLSWIPDDGRLILKENFSASGDRGLIVTNYNDKDDPTSYDGGSSKYIIVKPTDIIRDTGSGTESVTWDSSSDRRIKKNIVDLDYEMSIEMIDRTNPKRFEFINKDGVYYGMIAQDVRELLDDLGETNSHLEYSQGDLNVKDQRAIDYEEYIPHLINYVKDLRAELNRVKTELAELKEG